MTQKRFIPNPNKMSDAEQNFIKKGFKESKTKNTSNTKKTYKGRMISMPDSFYEKLNNFLKIYPTEGNRSSFIVRVVAEYMDKKL